MQVVQLRPAGVLDTPTWLQYSQLVRAGNLLFASGQAGLVLSTTQVGAEEIKVVVEHDRP